MLLIEVTILCRLSNKPPISGHATSMVFENEYGYPLKIIFPIFFFLTEIFSRFIGTVEVGLRSTQCPGGNLVSCLKIRSWILIQYRQPRRPLICNFTRLSKGTLTEIIAMRGAIETVTCTVDLIVRGGEVSMLKSDVRDTADL
ncbi:hypothetical protein J6590_050470 [Homalodisca vitripennis]|nr:hypothetical protein J6590_050470 [Homalodisca vitripennis]